MHFPELEVIRQFNPTDQTWAKPVEDLDRYLAGHKACEIDTAAALRTVGGDKDTLLRTLFLLAFQNGLVRVEYRVYCRVSGRRIYIWHHLGGIPSAWPCECTGRPHTFTAKDITPVFFLKRA